MQMIIKLVCFRQYRSPDPEGARASMGGWGLGVGNEELAGLVSANTEDDDDEDLPSDWDQAQVSSLVSFLLH